MAFKIKDLMISDLSSAAHQAAYLCGARQISHEQGTKYNYGCKYACTNTGALGQEYYLYEPCPNTCHGTVGCGGTIHCPGCSVLGVTPIRSGEEGSHATLSALKEQLKQQLADVEKQQAALEASMLPETVQEVDELTKKLNDALEELKLRRAELSKKA